MATYIPGIQDYIPQIQPFKPDFNFFQSALEHKQQQYQAGYNRISSIYGQMLNSELLRQDNKDRRDSLFTQIDADIKRLSGVDLSLQENVMEASKLFQPLIDNEYFRKDVAFTKQYYGQLKRADGLKRSPDPKNDERYWQEGVTALHYQAEDFSKSTDDESMRYGNPQYTPYINTTEKLFKFAKDNDINPESLAFSGGFIYKYTNGQQAIPNLQNTFSSVLLSDPRVKAMTETQAYLERKNYSKENAVRFNNDEFAAETEYLQNKVTEINQYYAQLNKQTNEKLEAAGTNKKAIEGRIATYGIDPELDKDLVAMYQGTLSDQSILAADSNKNKEVLSQVDGIDINGLDRESLRYRVDNALSYFKIDDLALTTASQYATSKAKVDFQVNPYDLEAVKFRNSWVLQQDDFEKKKTLKIMDIATEILKQSGDAVPGGSLNPLLNTGGNIAIPGPGGTTLENVAIQGENEAALGQTTDVNTALAKSNIQSFLDFQNNILTDPSTTPEQKQKAEQDIKSVLGEYQILEKQQAYTKEGESLPTDWSKVSTGIGQTLLGLGAWGEAIAGTIFTGGATLPAQVAVGIAGSAALGAGASNIVEGFSGVETINVPESASKTAGIVTKNANGKYELVSDLRNLADPNSTDYYNEVNKRVLNATSQAHTLYKGTPYEDGISQAKIAMQGRQADIDKGNQLIASLKNTMTQNNQQIGTAMANEAGTTAETSKLFWRPDMTGARTENEFVAAYVEANKNNLDSYPKHETSFLQYVVGSTFSDFTGDRTYGSEVTEEDRLADMREDAIDMYEELVSAHETLSKNPDGNLNLKSVFDDKLVTKDGLNRFYTNAAYYGFDAAAYNTLSFGMAMDFLQKDFIPKTASPSFRDENGARVVYGSGFDITADQYASEEFQHNNNAELALKTFLASSSMNYGGKTGENQKRPTGTFYLNAVAANDGNKVAMTWDMDPAWIAEHAGTEKAQGPTWQLQQRLSEGKDTKVTFFMDANKAESAPFQAMKMSTDEMLMNLDGQITINNFDDAGQVTISKNALGGYSYNGYAKAIDQLGNIISNPIFGSSDGDVNSITNYFKDTFTQISRSNINQLNSIRDNSVKNPGQVSETEE
jgi:hypothetical protein